MLVRLNSKDTVSWGDRRTDTAIIGLVCAVLFHGAYDFCLFQNASLILLLMVFPVMGWAFYLSRRAINVAPFSK